MYEVGVNTFGQTSIRYSGERSVNVSGGASTIEPFVDILNAHVYGSVTCCCGLGVGRGMGRGETDRGETGDRDAPEASDGECEYADASEGDLDCTDRYSAGVRAADGRDCSEGRFRVGGVNTDRATAGSSVSSSWRLERWDITV